MAFYKLFCIVHKRTDYYKLQRSVYLAWREWIGLEPHDPICLMKVLQKHVDADCVVWERIDNL